MEQYLVVVEGKEPNYSAYSPDVPGCVAAGKTVEETLKNMKEALTLHLEGIAEDGDEFPQPKGLLFYLSQDDAIAEPEDLLTYIEVRQPTVV